MSEAPVGRASDLQVVAPYWLDRPDEEALEIAAEARRNGFPVTEIHARLASYREAGASAIGLVPATAEDPAGRRTLAALAPR